MPSDGRLNQLLARWHELRQQGSCPTPEELCGDDPELLDALRRHLTDATLTLPPATTPSPLDQANEPTIDLPGRPLPGMPDVPGYDILRELGRGGMGVVYQARHLTLKRTVALKMLLAGSHASADERQRFRTEAEAVARLQHPGIVQIYEIGDYQGLPYVALEYCGGGNLKSKLAGNSLPPAEAAHLVEQLARAMAVAHQQRIIHRDLKPRNILLADSGAAKIADFGLAKKLDDPGLTHTRVVIGTPNYMPPEQARGDTSAVGPLADVYALGAILYELLTGRPPFVGASTEQVLAQVTGQEPVPPRRLQPQLPRDLETIALCCLQKEPGRRYASAAALADDLRRFQVGEPIMARPVGRLERAWKWARRRPAVASLSAALLLAVVVGFALVTWKWLQERQARELAQLKEREAELAGARERQAKEQESVARKRAEANEAKEANAREQERQAKESEHQARKEAEKQRDLALKYFARAQDAVRQMLTEVSENDDLLKNEPRFEQVRKTLLEKALGHYQEFLKEKSNDPTVRLATAVAYRGVGDIHSQLGSKEEAEKADRGSVDLLKQLSREFPDETTYRWELAISCNNLGILLYKTGRLPEAEKLFLEAQGLCKQLTKQFPAVANYRYYLADICKNLGMLVKAIGRLPEAESLLRQAVQLNEQLVADYPTDAGYRWNLAGSCNNLAMLLLAAGQLSEAENRFRQAIQLQQELAAAFPKVVGYRHGLAGTFGNLSVLLEDAGRMEETEALLRQAIALDQQVVHDFPTVTGYRQSLAHSCTNLARLLSRTGHFEEAEKLLRQAVELRQQLADDSPTVVDYRKDLANVCHNLAELLEETGREPEAEKLFGQALALRQQLVDDYPAVVEYRKDLANTCNSFGILLKATGRWAQAEKLYRQALQLRQRLAADFPTVAVYRDHLATTCNNLALILEKSNRQPEAEKLHRQALKLYEELMSAFPTVAEYRSGVAVSCNNLANLLNRTGRAAEAEQLHRRAVELRLKLVADFPTVALFRQQLAHSCNNLAVVLKATNRLPEAEKLHRQARLLFQKLAADFPTYAVYRKELAVTDLDLGSMLQKAGRLSEAERHFRQSFWSFHQLDEQVPRQVQYTVEAARALIGLGTVYASQQHYRKARPVFEHALKHLDRVLEQDPNHADARAGKFACALPLAMSCAMLGQHADAAAALDSAGKVADKDAKKLFIAAVLYAWCVQLATQDAELSPDERQQRAKAYGDQTIALLQQAIANGYQGAAALKTDPVFAPLRERADFQALIRQLEMKGQPGGLQSRL
jgi:tetratricopeptide (TPR) repeat protein